MNDTMSILFVIKLNKQNQKGLCPLNVRLTYQKERKEFSSGLFVNPSSWNAKKQLVMPIVSNADFLNNCLIQISQRLNNCFLSLQLNSLDFKVNDIFDKYTGKIVKKEDNVVNYFRRFLAKKSQLIDKDIKEATWKKFEYVCNDLEAFIISDYKKKDFPMNKLNPQFLADFEYYLKTEKGQRQVTVNKAVQRLRKPIKVAVAEGYLDKDPFAQHKPGRVRKEVVFLSTDELRLLEEHQFTQPRLELVKDLFVFCCYTGLAYHEMANLKKENIVKGFDGNEWIQMKREKTSKMISVPLLPKAKTILAKYDETECRLP